MTTKFTPNCVHCLATSFCYHTCANACKNFTSKILVPPICQNTLKPMLVAKNFNIFSLFLLSYLNRFPSFHTILKKRLSHILFVTLLKYVSSDNFKLFIRVHKPFMWENLLSTNFSNILTPLKIDKISKF
jgi:hypothetical protein